MAYFAASVDTADVNSKFAQSLELDFPILSDPGKDVAKAYGVVTAERALAARWTFYIGKDGKVLYVDKSGATATQAQEILSRLKALGIVRQP